MKRSYGTYDMPWWWYEMDDLEYSDLLCHGIDRRQFYKQFGANMIEITIPGKPIAKKRPRFFRRGKYVGTYNDQKTEEGKFMLQVKEQFDLDLIEGSIDLWLKFFMPIPKSTSKKNRKSMNLGLIRHTKRPDLDNLIKFTKDCLNEIVWKDDSQVCRIEATKKYDDMPRTEIRIFC